jgi:hypothetical protein
MTERIEDRLRATAAEARAAGRATVGEQLADLVAAVREEGHYGSCSRLGKGGECDCPMRFLAALDEEAARG